MRKLWFRTVLTLVLTAATSVVGAGGGLPAIPPSPARLIAEVAAARPGEPFWVGIRISLPTGWHTYWRNPGDSGMAPHVDWTLPAGWRHGDLQWPAPHRFDEPPLVSFGYGGDVLLMAQVFPPAGTAAGSNATLRARVDWLMCKDICVPRSADLDLALPVRQSAAEPDPDWATAFAQGRTRLPEQAPGWSFDAAVGARQIRLRVVPPAAVAAGTISRSMFFPVRRDLVTYGYEAGWQRSGSGYVLVMTRQTGMASLPQVLEGVLVVPEAGDGERSVSALALEVRAPIAVKEAN